ncbi:hypothetical protein [Actinomadura formosensis]|uniref:hypothetical protein n=1 Tax=Actinomadura formosensis TaxID=60706 RepID=UPI003D8D685A
MPEVWVHDYDRTLRDRLASLVVSMRRIHAHRDAGRLTKLRWYLWELYGWALHQWQSRPWCLRYPFAKLYSLPLRALRVRPWRPGDGVARLVLTEPWSAWASWSGRLMCRRFGRHNDTCRGNRACPPSWENGKP